MKKKATTLILGILLIGIVNAGLVGYLSNIVSGQVEVSGPIFYASDGHPLPDHNAYLLGINNFTERDPVSFSGTSNKIFVSEQLGINSFYETDYHMFLEARSTANENQTGQIDAELWVIEGNDPHNKKEMICYGSTTEPVDEHDIYEIICHGEELELEETDRFMWILSDGANSITYYIYIEGETKIEIEAQ